MSLVDRTNEEIHLAMHDELIVVDSDSDSSVWHERWVTVYGLGETQDFHFNLTLEKAGKFRDRLNLILGENPKAEGWDAAVAAMRYEDGSPVEVIESVNPFRSKKKGVQ